MTTATTQKESVLLLARKLGILNRQDVRDAALPEEYLSRLTAENALIALALGIYMSADHEPGAHLDLAIVCKRIPECVIFGISALQFHDITTQVAHSVQIAIKRGKWTPQLEWPAIEVFHISSKAFSLGIERHTIENNTEIQVYSVARTVADLFKFRNHFGLDVAIEALREGWRDQRFTMKELYECAKICRVQSVMRPYMEMLE